MTRRCAPWSRSARHPRTCCCASCAPGRRWDFAATPEAAEAWLESLDVYAAVGELGPQTELLLLHARGDEQVPWTVSEELHAAAHEPKRLLVLPGGHHRSLQHDLELQAVSRHFILAAAERAAAER